ncbi:snare-like protein [Xylariaceae sp. FL0662B]|nr:snare-like protein [Xylariaceae sp. FL0662B]
MPIQVFSFYIFDRHTECVYSKLWVPPAALAPTHAPTPSSSSVSAPTSAQPNGGGAIAAPAPRYKGSRTSAADDAKLIFGTVFSLRNMVRKLGGDDDAFISFRTAQYKLHYYETPTNLRFVLLTEPGALSMRNVLHQIYINLWVEYVVKNPLSPVEHKGGDGVRNEMFEMGLDKFVRGLM